MTVISFVKCYLCSVLSPSFCGYTLCNVNVIKLTRVLPCLLTAALNYKNNPEQNSHLTTKLSIPTTRRDNQGLMYMGISPPVVIGKIFPSHVFIVFISVPVCFVFFIVFL